MWDEVQESDSGEVRTRQRAKVCVAASHHNPRHRREQSDSPSLASQFSAGNTEDRSSVSPEYRKEVSQMHREDKGHFFFVNLTKLWRNVYSYSYIKI